jgi:hypothetical protein
MSRTDVHRPWRVQLADPYNRHLLRRHQAWPALPDGIELVPIRNLLCGCRMCTDHFGRRWARRRDRHEAKRALRRGEQL